MNCQNCGNFNNENNKFCINCGIEIIFKEDYYSILGIARNSSKDDIKKAYHILAHQYHPDKNNGNEKRFKKINEAYRILSGDITRKEYDDELRNKSDSNNYKNSEKQSGSKEEKTPGVMSKEDKKHNQITNITLAIALSIIGIIVVVLYSPMSPSEDSLTDSKEKIPNTILDTSEYLTIGGEPTIKDDFSFRLSWLTADQVLEKKEVLPINEYSYEEPRTNGMFAIAIVSITNNGKERKLISLNDFSFIDTQGRIYEPYFNAYEMKSTFDEKGKIVTVYSGLGDIKMLIQPGIEEKRAIIFEIAKDIKSASLKFKYNK